MKIEFCYDLDKIRLSAKFFVENVNNQYISHGEIQDGRAIDFHTWHPNLEEIIFNEFQKTIEVDNDQGKKYLLLIAHENRDIVGLSFMTVCKNNPDFSFILIQDLLVREDKRHKGIGTLILNWIENELKTFNADCIFLESGIRNEDAHRFFARNGYHICSKVMTKKTK